MTHYCFTLNKKASPHLKEKLRLFFYITYGLSYTTYYFAAELGLSWLAYMVHI
jgi:hypothetical protein